jgi:hypothetical protein
VVIVFDDDLIASPDLCEHVSDIFHHLSLSHVDDSHTLDHSGSWPRQFERGNPNLWRSYFGPRRNSKAPFQARLGLVTPRSLSMRSNTDSPERPMVSDERNRKRVNLR